jgi:hypothetical protein
MALRRPTPMQASPQPKQANGFTFDILSAQDFSPHETFLYVVAGPPKTGKSWLLGEMSQEGPTLLIATLRREVTSAMYAKYNPNVILLEDREWQPLAPDPKTGAARGLYNATAFLRFMELMQALADDEITNADGEPYRVVLIDSGTELAEFAWHEALKPHAVMSPAYMDGERSRFLPYETLATLLDQSLNAIGLLKTAPTPKHVGISWHVQPAKEDTTEKVSGAPGAMQRKASADHKAEGVEYEGNILPMIRGGFRRKLFGKVDGVVWTDIQHRGSDRKPLPRPAFVLQVQPDEDRLAGLPGQMSDTKYITNSWQTLKQLLAVTP